MWLCTIIMLTTIIILFLFSYLLVFYAASSHIACMCLACTPLLHLLRTEIPLQNSKTQNEKARNNTDVLTNSGL